MVPRTINVPVPSNALSSTQFFRRQLFFSKIYCGNSFPKFVAMSKFRIYRTYVMMKSILQLKQSMGPKKSCFRRCRNCHA